MAYQPDSAVDVNIPLGEVRRTVGLVLGNGDGTFQASVDSPLVDGPFGRFMVAASDLDGDGKVDLVATTGYGSKVAVLLNAP